MKNIKSIFSLFLFGISLSGAFAQEPASADKQPEKKWYDKVNMFGYVDAYYQYSSNNKQGAQYDSTKTFHSYNKQFALNNAVLGVEKIADKDDPWGFRLKMQAGQNTTHQENNYLNGNNLHNMNMLQEAYISMYFPIMKGLTVDMGKMATHIGYELLDSMSNPNYTIGYIFFNTIPFIHTGARASLTINDNWGFSFYLYNSVQGTGYNSAGQKAGSNDHVYADGPNKASATGTQLKGKINDKLTVIWNTLYGSDQISARLTNAENAVLQVNPALAMPKKKATIGQDYWFLNDIILSITPNDKLIVDLDWTFAEKAGAAAPNTKEGISADTFSTALGGPVGELGNLSTASIFNRDGRHVKRRYNTYGVWVKYAMTQKFTLALRYEYLDDSRWAGNFGSAGNLPTFRYDLQKRIELGDKVGYGQVRTFTITPTFFWTQNLIIKLDLRRDWALGYQFVDEQGRPAGYQNAAILGVVAKF